ncbi:MAG: ABC transporter permease [Gemmatimonadetes bacterium]|nr:ABC transporter permease [Gemmatimonadota bacterium]
MSLISEIRVRLRGLFARESMDREMDQELAYHLERETERLMSRGVAAADARRQARAAFGGVSVAREAVRDERGVAWMEDLGRDLRHGLRALSRRPLYWFTAAVTLGLGIAATTAIFSIVSYLLLRPLPVPDADRLVAFGQVVRSRGDASPSLSLPTIRDLRTLSDVFDGVVAGSGEVLGIRDEGGEGAVQLFANAVTGNYFTFFGLRPAAGRFFTQADEDRREPVIVLSHSLWQARYGGDPSVVGRTVLLNGSPFTVLGVSPAGWQGTEHLVEAQAFLPLQLLPTIGVRTEAQMDRRGSDFLRTFARLAPGRTVADARSALAVLAARLAPEREEVVGDYSFLVELEVRSRPVIVIADQIPMIAVTFLGLSVLALGIACVNVGNLVLSRTMARRGELAVRRALGASRSRVARELIAEALLLGVSALVIALPVAWLVVSWLAGLNFAADIPLKIDVRLDRTVLVFAGAIAVLAGVLTGVAPALRGSNNDAGDALREGAARATATRERRRLGNTLLAGQLTFSLVLVIAGALFLRSLNSVTSLDLGIDPSQVAMATVDLSLSRYEPAASREFFRRAEEGLRALPGVASVGMMRDVPMGFNGNGRSLQHLDGRMVGNARHLSAQINTLTPDAFATLRLRQVEGRIFDAHDDGTAPRRAIVNDVLARQFWPERTGVVGQRFRIVGDSTPIEVVGVVTRVISEFPTEKPVPQFFLPYAQFPGPTQTLFVRTVGDPSLVLGDMRRVLHAIDPGVAVGDLRSMHAFLHDGKAFFLYRLGSALTLAIGALGLLQTLVGLYGVIAYAVGQRSREFGIRLALGASRRQLIGQVMGPSLRLVAAGLAVGLLGAALLLPVTATLLAVSPRDPLTYLACTAFLASLAALALYLPARRAANAGPMRALRSD